MVCVQFPTLSTYTFYNPILCKLFIKNADTEKEIQLRVSSTQVNIIQGDIQILFTKVMIKAYGWIVTRIYQALSPKHRESMSRDLTAMEEIMDKFKNKYPVIHAYFNFGFIIKEDYSFDSGKSYEEHPFEIDQQPLQKRPITALSVSDTPKEETLEVKNLRQSIAKIQYQIQILEKQYKNKSVINKINISQDFYKQFYLKRLFTLTKEEFLQDLSLEESYSTMIQNDYTEDEFMKLKIDMKERLISQEKLKTYSS